MVTLICNDIALGKTYLRRIHCPWMIACYLDHHLQYRVGAGADARIPADDLNKSSTGVWRDKDLCSFRIFSLQASILVIPCPVDVRCSFESLFSNTLMSASTSLKLLNQIWSRHDPLFRLRLRLLIFFKVALLPNFNTICVARDHNLMNSEIRTHRRYRTYEFEIFAYYIGSRGKRICSERPALRRRNSEGGCI